MLDGFFLNGPLARLAEHVSGQGLKLERWPGKDLIIMSPRTALHSGQMRLASAAIKGREIESVIVAIDSPGDYIDGAQWDKIGDPVRDMFARMDAQRNAPMRGHAIIDENDNAGPEVFKSIAAWAFKRKLETGLDPIIEIKNEEG